MEQQLELAEQESQVKYFVSHQNLHSGFLKAKKNADQTDSDREHCFKENNNFILKEYQEYLNILNNESEESSSVPALETELEQLLLEESQLQSQLEVIIRTGEPVIFFPTPAPTFFLSGSGSFF